MVCALNSKFIKKKAVALVGDIMYSIALAHSDRFIFMLMCDITDTVRASNQMST